MIKKIAKNVYYSLFDNSPKNFDKPTPDFDIKGFLENADKIRDAYDKTCEKFYLLKYQIKTKHFETIEKFKEFIDDVYIHCNPNNNVINQLMIGTLCEKMLISLNKMENFNNMNELEIANEMEIIETQINDIMIKTKYFINKERESIYKDMYKMKQYYTYRRRFISFLRFVVIYVSIILIIKFLINGIVYLDKPYEIIRWFRLNWVY